MDTARSQGSTAWTLKQILIFFLLFLAGDFFSSLPFDLLFSVVRLPVRELYAILRTAGCLLLTCWLFWLYTTKALHLSMGEFGITFAVKAWGVLSAVLLPAFVAAVFLLIGDTAVHLFPLGKTLLMITASLLTALKAGILEEMLFRGFIMKLVETRWNKAIAVLLPSFLFSLLHLPSMEAFSAAGVMLLVVSGTLVGIMFSLAAYKGGSVSNSVLLHAGWNFVMITNILHITTAEGAYGTPLVSVTIPSEPIWLTGGGFGVEASIVAIIGYALICGFLSLQKQK